MRWKVGVRSVDIVLLGRALESADPQRRDACSSSRKDAFGACDKCKAVAPLRRVCT
jgi:hypothetical protein